MFDFVHLDLFFVGYPSGMIYFLQGLWTDDTIIFEDISTKFLVLEYQEQTGCN